MRLTNNVIISIFVCILILGTLYPFNFTIPVFFKKYFFPIPKWTVNDGMVFKGSGMYSLPGTRPEIAAAIARKKSFYIYVEAYPDFQNQRGPSRIFSYSKNPLNQNFMLGQSENSFVFRLATSINGREGRPVQFDFHNGIVAKKWNHILLIYNKKRIRAFSNGRYLGDFTSPETTPDKWPGDHYLIAGNESTGDRGWSGKIRRLVLDAGEVPSKILTEAMVDPSNELWERARGGAGKALLNISADKNLLPTDWLPHKTELWGDGISLPWRLVPFLKYDKNERQVIDWAINILMFFPLGWMFQRKGISLLKILLICLSISFIIEMTQLFVSERISSITDFVLNGCGGFIGGLFAYKAKKNRPDLFCVEFFRR